MYQRQQLLLKWNNLEYCFNFVISNWHAEMSHVSMPLHRPALSVAIVKVFKSRPFRRNWTLRAVRVRLLRVISLRRIVCSCRKKTGIWFFHVSLVWLLNWIWIVWRWSSRQKESIVTSSGRCVGLLPGVCAFFISESSGIQRRSQYPAVKSSKTTLFAVRSKEAVCCIIRPLALRFSSGKDCRLFPGIQSDSCIYLLSPNL